MNNLNPISKRRENREIEKISDNDIFSNLGKLNNLNNNSNNESNRDNVNSQSNRDIFEKALNPINGTNKSDRRNTNNNDIFENPNNHSSKKSISFLQQFSPDNTQKNLIYLNNQESNTIIPEEDHSPSFLIPKTTNNLNLDVNVLESDEENISKSSKGIKENQTERERNGWLKQIMITNEVANLNKGATKGEFDEEKVFSDRNEPKRSKKGWKLW